ncbi:alkane hydroxylase MAH1-like [Henckelia pumila]|uniref:alkane hydroxylase MAH1-like n=1 Tax=Henckelia pumila TaxID=405737 RepID=UPI003C6E70BA
MPTLYLESHRIYDKTAQMLSQNKGTILFKTSWISNIDILVTSDLANVQHIMNSKFSIYQRGLAFKDVFDFLRDATFNKTTLDEWKEDKKLTHAYFKQNDFHKTSPRIIHHTLEKGLVPILDHAAELDVVVDLQSLFNRYMLDATCILGTGFDPGSLRNGFPETPLLKAMDDIGEAAFYRHILPEKLWKLQRFLNVGREKKMVEASKTFDRILEDFVSKKQESSPNGPENGDDFDVLKFYMIEAAKEESKQGSNKHLQKVFLTSNLMSFLFAGRDTSGALLTWFFWQISQNPSVKTKILQEIEHVCPKSVSQKHIFSNVDELGKLVYLHSALSEALRLFPTAPFLLRVPNQQDLLPSGHKVNQDTKVVLCS